MYILISLLYLTFFGYSTYARSCVEGYYWRDHTGTIPSDAVSIIGVNRKAIYVGQTLHIEPSGGKLIPGTIYPHLGQSMDYNWNNKKYTVTQNIKILCSSEPELFEWSDVTEMGDIESLNNEEFVEGGFDDGNKLYVGKVNNNGKTIIGKIALDKNNEGMGFIFGDTAEHTQNDFNILSFRRYIIH